MYYKFPNEYFFPVVSIEDLDFAETINRSEEMFQDNEEDATKVRHNVNVEREDVEVIESRDENRVFEYSECSEIMNEIDLEYVKTKVETESIEESK